MNEKELILLKEVQKYSEINDRLLEKNAKLIEKVISKSDQLKQLRYISRKMARTIKYLEGSHSERMAEIAKKLSEEYQQIVRGSVVNE